MIFIKFIITWILLIIVDINAYYGPAIKDDSNGLNNEVERKIIDTKNEKMNHPYGLHDLSKDKRKNDSEETIKNFPRKSLKENSSISFTPKNVKDEVHLKVPPPPKSTITSAAASEQLQCHKNVIEFVINATDLKDECVGLRSAFDASCSILDNQKIRKLEVNSKNKKNVDKVQIKPLRKNKLPRFQKRGVQKRKSWKAKEELEHFLKTKEALYLQTCCTSILQVYHDHCDHSNNDDYNDTRLFGIVFIIGLCSLIKSLIRYYKIRFLSEAGGCILVGLISGMALNVVPDGFDENLFLRVMLPPIIFEAALSINKRAFLRHSLVIFINACVGTIFCTFVIAYIVNKGSSWLPYCETIPMVDSLLFGSLISSIDPIAVLSILTNLGCKNTDALYVIIFGESLLNDGVAIVLFDTLRTFLHDHVKNDSNIIWNGVQHFVVVAFGSIFVGCLCGAVGTCCFWAMSGCHSPLVEVLSFFCSALIPYYICDGLHWSGIVALVATGFIMDLYVIGERHDNNEDYTTKIVPPSSSRVNMRRRPHIFCKEGHMSNIAKNHVGFVTLIIATLMETAIFAYLGLFLFSYRYHWSFSLGGLAIFSCLASRGIMVFIFTIISNSIIKSRIRTRAAISSRKNTDSDSHLDKFPLLIVDKRMQIMIWFAGLRGAMSFALVESIPLYDRVTEYGSRFKPELKAMTSASVAFTIFILGGSTFYLMERLGVHTTILKNNVKQPLKQELLPILSDRVT